MERRRLLRRSSMHRRLLSLTRTTRLGLTVTVASGLLAGLLTIGQAWLVSLTINSVFLEKKTLLQVSGWMQALLVVIALRGLLVWLNEAAASSVAVRIKDDLRRALFAHILALGPSYTRGQQTGDLAAAANEGIEALDAYYSQYLPQLVISTLVPLSVLFIVFPLDPLSGAILLFTAPLIPFFMYMIGRGASELTGRQYETLTRLSAHFLDSLQGLTTLKLFGQSRAQVRNIASVSDQFRRTTLRVLQVTFLSALALELLATISTAIIAVEVGLRLLYGRMEFLPALFILVLAPEFYLPLRMLGLRFHAGMSGTSAAKRIYQILDMPLPYQPAPGSASAAPGFTFQRLELSDLSHTYQGETVPALDHLNLDVRAGEHLALVGRSGAGKTTLANLLLRFFDPSDGRILVNGVPLQDLPVEDWRKQIAWVPQNPSLWHDTLAANLRLGKPDATPQELAGAARLAHLDEFIDSLPLKYETLIGEGGARLSSGQAQRLALARAFLKDAPILILDEPTSSLDPATESLLEASTRRLMQGRTVITIAHRLNTVFRADRIVLLEGGQIVETGSHHELMEKGGLYAQMVASYSEGFTPSVQETESLSLAPTANPPAAAAPSGTGSVVPRRVFFRLLGFIKGSWGSVALSVLLSTFTIASSIALMGTSAWLISMAALHPSIAALGVAVVGVRFFGIARGVFRYLERLVSHNVTFSLLSRLRVWFYERLEPLAPARLMEYRSGDLLARIVGDVETLENFYIRVVSPPLTALLIAAGTALFLASRVPLLAGILLSLFLLLGLILPLLSQLLTRRSGEEWVRQRAGLHTLVVDGVQGLADLLAFNGEGRVQAELSRQSGLYGASQGRLARISGLFSGLNTFLTNLGLWLVLWICIPLVTSGRLEPVMLASLGLLTLASFEAVTPLPLAAQMWNQVRESASRLFEVVDARPAVQDSPSAQPLPPLPAASLGRIVEFDDLSFTYPGQMDPALQGVSFSIEPGKAVAVVGPSGAGKSTLASLLLRFWEYSSGEIRMDGRPLRTLAQEEVRSGIGLISSASHFFNTSVYENLRLARRRVTREEIEAAAGKAQIHETILRMPQGYDTLIGERGQRLSGGERQRLTIARALIKDAPLLILDEPTANLDALTEQQVLETLFEVMRGRTALLITHRLVGMENMDEILVLDRGRIVERGSHASLLAREGLYRRMWNLQSRVLEEVI